MFQIKNLHVKRDGNEIIKGINLNIHPNETHVIMGPNGSGKSTLATALMGSEDFEISKGSVVLDNKNITNLPATDRSKLGLFLAFQYPFEVEGVSFFQFLKLIYEEKHGKNIKTVDFLELLQLLCKSLDIDTTLINRYLNVGFSGGEKKKAEILQLALLEPKYVILDETDSGLDISSLKTVSENIFKVKKKLKCGIIIITHYSRILKYLKPDFVHVLDNGVITKSGGIEVVKKLEKQGFKNL